MMGGGRRLLLLLLVLVALAGVELAVRGAARALDRSVNLAAPFLAPGAALLETLAAKCCR